MDELLGHFAQWKELDTKGHILYDSTYLRFLECQIHGDSRMAVAR